MPLSWETGQTVIAPVRNTFGGHLLGDPHTRSASSPNHFLGHTSQLIVIGVDFSGDCDGFCDGCFGQDGRILRWILWWIFCLVFLLRKRQILGRNLGPCELGQRRKKGESNLRVQIHSKIHDQNPRRAPGETCCLHFLDCPHFWLVSQESSISRIVFKLSWLSWFPVWRTNHPLPK